MRIVSVSKMAQFMTFQYILSVLHLYITVMHSINAAPMTIASEVGEVDNAHTDEPTFVLTSVEIGIKPTQKLQQQQQQQEPEHNENHKAEHMMMAKTTLPTYVIGEKMVTPAALMELLPHEKQLHKEQMLKHQQMIERLRLEHEKKLWEERERLRLTYAHQESDEQTESDATTLLATTTETKFTTQSVPDITLPGGKKKRPENPILKKFKISNSKGIMVFRSIPTTPRITTPRTTRITTEPATTSTTLKPPTTATIVTEKPLATTRTTSTTATTTKQPSLETTTPTMEVTTKMDLAIVNKDLATTTTTKTTLNIASVFINSQQATSTTEMPLTEPTTMKITIQNPPYIIPTSSAITSPSSYNADIEETLKGSQQKDKMLNSTLAMTTIPNTKAINEMTTERVRTTENIMPMTTTLTTMQTNDNQREQHETTALNLIPSTSTVVSGTTSMGDNNIESLEINSIASNEIGGLSPTFNKNIPSATPTVTTAMFNHDGMLNDQPVNNDDLATEEVNYIHKYHLDVEMEKTSESLRKALQKAKEQMEGEFAWKEHNKKMLEDTHRIGGKSELRQTEHNNGHDGVKITKKKQLINNQSDTLEVPMTEINGGELVPKILLHDVKQKDTKLVTPTPLIPIRNGFLGPIIMGEKVFSVDKPVPLQHEPSIEAQLREGRIVEIIAPTALLEDTVTTTTTTTTTQNDDKTAFTTLMPTYSEADKTTPVLSTTVFQVAERIGSTTRLPLTKTVDNANLLLLNKENANGQQTESKISDIQVEVYDSTIDSLVSSTNTKDSEAFSPVHHANISASVTTKPPSAFVPQERFTQYVIDRTDSSTQESNIGPMQLPIGATGKPEPAAIEIHINVSEGIGGTESEDLEFSYPQRDYNYDNAKLNMGLMKNSESISLKPFMRNGQLTQTNDTTNNSDEILIVEIIDTGDNNTDQSASSSSSESANPVFTFRADSETEDELKPDTELKTNDELFMIGEKKEEIEYLHPPPPPPPPPPRKSTIDRDSDTIFYISNTEVKVGESLPDINEHYEQSKREKIESNIYGASTHPNPIKGEAHRYEEDIILSPLSDTADSLKIFRTQPDSESFPSHLQAPSLDVTYVGESIMEVEQLQGVTTTTTSTTTSTTTTTPQQPDIIIQPVILPEMSIGVPVIGELPPQIELKEIDFMPDEANQQRPSMYDNNNNNNIEDTNNANDVEHLVESSIQYGGDLIDLGASNSFDGVEGSYPFGNPIVAQRHDDDSNDSEYSHYYMQHNHGVSHLRKDVLTADIASASVENDTLRDANSNETIANMTSTAERRINISLVDNTTSEQMLLDRWNATVHSKRLNSDDELNKENDDFEASVGLLIALLFILTPIIVTISMACALRYLYHKYRRNSPDSTEANENAPENYANGVNGHAGESTQPPSLSLSDLDQENQSAHLSETKPMNNEQKPSNINLNSLETIDEKANDATQTDNINSKFQTNTNLQQLGVVVVGGGGVDGCDKKNNSFATKRECAGMNGPNGSVTKMTLKNNHLIVETEERNDISRDARETKMHYNTNDKDGIFVVEVSRGIDSKAIADSPLSETIEHRFPPLDFQPKNICNMKSNLDELMIKKHQEVEVHPPPAELQSLEPSDDVQQRSLHQIEEVEEPASIAAEEHEPNCKTGLSQSDLSSTSSSDSNKRYSYGNQELYVIDQPGYESTMSSALILPPAEINAKKTSQEDDDHKSENGNTILNDSPTSQVNAQKSNAANENANEDDIIEEQNEITDLKKVIDDETIQTKEENSPDENSNENAVADECVNESETILMAPEEFMSKATNNISESDLMDKEELNNEAIDSFILTIEDKNEISTENLPLAIEKIDENVKQTVDIPELHYTDENGMDSIMSLPDPPSTDDIKEFTDDGLLEANQLDSLPPPPPPVLLTNDIVDNGNLEYVTNDLCLPLKPPANFDCLSNEIITNGNIHKMNGLADDGFPPPPPLATAIAELEEEDNDDYSISEKSQTNNTMSHDCDIRNDNGNDNEIENGNGNCNGKLITTASSPLTPPASPPATPTPSTTPNSSEASSPTPSPSPPPTTSIKTQHYRNGSISGSSLLRTPLPVAVDVNGS